MPTTTRTRTTSIAPEQVASQVRDWVHEAAARPVPRSAQLLADLLKDPKGLDFTVAFVDRVIRTEDPRAAASELKRLAADPPSFLPAPLRRVISFGGATAPTLPHAVIPTAQAVMRRMVSHLILDSRDPQLARSVRRLRAEGTDLNINVLGEAVLGAREAGRRLASVREMAGRDDVDYVSIKISSIVDHLSLWGAAETVDHVVETLLPLYLDASRQDSPTFLNMDMEEYRDLELTLDVFEKLLDRPELMQLRAGIVLQAYLPDSFAAMQRLRAFAKDRVARGGAPIKVRVVKGANLALETVDASLHGLDQAPFHTKEESDAQYKRILLDSLEPEHLGAVHLGIAGHNLFDVAFAHLLMGERGIDGADDEVEFEMLAGMAPGQQQVVREAVGSMRLYVPVVSPREFDVAVSYLVRRLEENASSENFMSAVFELDDSEDLFAREQARFEASLARAIEGPAEATHRDQDRAAEEHGERPALGSTVIPARPGAFRNTPDTDMSTAANQEWAAGIIHRVRGSRIGIEEIEAARVTTREGVDDVYRRALAAQETWARRGASERAQAVREVARVFAAHRADLLEVMAAETGKVLEQGDPEVSEAMDFALYYAEQAELLEELDDAVLTPRRLTLVTPPWNFPVAIPTGGVLSALVTGSAVVMKPAPQARRCGAIIGALVHEAGIDRDLVQIVDVPEDEVGRALIADPRVDQLVLTGAYDTAALFASWRPELPIKAETSGKNAVIVTPHADLDLAAKDVAASAFGHAGQKCSAASLVITVGSVARSRRFSSQLADAVMSLHVGYPTDPTSQMGPVIEEPAGKLADGLSSLGAGERWLAEPQQLDESGRLWSPGVREGVEPGSEYHLTEYFGPILGIVHADTLEEATEIQNGTSYGLTAGLHSLDLGEIAWWTQHVEAGNLYVNRGITGAIVERQAFGGWKRSAIGETSKAGGPNYLIHLMDAADVEGRRTPSGAIRDEATWLTTAKHSDAAHWTSTFAARDPQDLHGEINVLRYVPIPTVVRAAEGAREVELRRVLHAAATVGADIEVSVATGALRAAATQELPVGTTVRMEDADAFAAAVPAQSRLRIRLVGEADDALLGAISRRVEVALFRGPVTASGRIELLSFLHEQAISATDHRYGNIIPETLDVTGGEGYVHGRD
ncbi:bifunctional proline dehydrogenase/L-glutamate gamma-semialdehyde dehydrogenase [Brachybacterium sp. MASK1Z-5]|uniref:L-glutamate gamma-semialdehyde dehydrogenase n=1 Tax=Brachybacterium halotolerans TaxID=2795215 RepID=A0ABS1B6E2_9MICO|nr:bifunctional proline dehydrogenase/L-glutamate gamma-semialdehyde dehydrogenase [Brachybacterium halotolerans]MBK0330179.1 bifunctional proline dehydrogenase/L-glutamate gamma-semialdehyde dehydrogenase [Brachybacterium halotolerans]